MRYAPFGHGFLPEDNADAPYCPGNREVLSGSFSTYLRQSLAGRYSVISRLGQQELSQLLPVQSTVSWRGSHVYGDL